MGVRGYDAGIEKKTSTRGYVPSTWTCDQVYCTQRLPLLRSGGIEHEMSINGNWNLCCWRLGKRQVGRSEKHCKNNTEGRQSKHHASVPPLRDNAQRTVLPFTGTIVRPILAQKTLFVAEVRSLAKRESILRNQVGDIIILIAGRGGNVSRRCRPAFRIANHKMSQRKRPQRHSRQSVPVTTCVVTKRA